MSFLNKFSQKIVNLMEIEYDTPQKFINRFYENYFFCKWHPHPLYSVFTQYDQEYYFNNEEAFIHKYRCFYAVSKTVSPQRIIELGTHAGSGADAYLSATPSAEYIGIDVFGEGVRHDNGLPWKPYDIAKQLFEAREFKNYELVKTDLRTLEKLPSSSDFIVVDAAHDFENEYADLKLALTATPSFIFVDDIDGDEARLAVEKFLDEYLKNKVKYTVRIDYIGGGLIIKMKQ